MQPNEVCDYEFVIYWDENSENQTPSNVLFDIQLDYEQYTNTIISPNSLQTLHEHVNFCKYIESTGTQYIDTGLNAKEHPNLVVEIEGSYTSLKTQQYIFAVGSNETSVSSYILMGQTNELGLIGQIGKNDTEKKIIDSDTKKHIFKLDAVSNKATIDSTVVDMFASGLKDINYNYVLFAINNKGNVKNFASFKMYSCKIIENNSLILNLMPCLDDEDVPCMYDSVSKSFFYNNGTGTFRYE